MRTTEVSSVEANSTDDVLSSSILNQITAHLPEFIASRRWFRSKTRTIHSVEIEDVLRIGRDDSYLLVARLNYSEGEADHYLIDVALENSVDEETLPDGAQIVGTYNTGDGHERNVYAALSQKTFRDALLSAITCNRTVPGNAGELRAARTIALPQDCGRPDFVLDSSVGKAEQSNTSILYGDRFIMKLFRKIEAGVNPDIEIGTFLTERGFKHTPAVFGKLEYTRLNDGDVYAAGILQQFVPNRGDAWKYTLDSLSGFFDRALKAGEYAPTLSSYHPADLAGQPTSPELRQLIGDYADSARLLGQLTAEMHVALADPEGGPDFAPAPFTPSDGEQLHREMLDQADIAFELLRHKQSTLEGGAAESARTVIHEESRIRELFSPLRNQAITAARIRVHGDYHLGQVLYTGTDFMIIDFEGEPARPLTERRGKTLAMRDVAGMVRSFQYAAYAALFGQVEGVPTGPESREGVESWAALWNVLISAAYLQGYFSAAQGSTFLPANARERRVLLDSYLLQKALYEVAYELNNRPDWVQIPLRGILSLVN